jgi:hypothetical protein
VASHLQNYAARACDRSAYDEGDYTSGLPTQIGPQTKFRMYVLRRAHGKPLKA